MIALATHLNQLPASFFEANEVTLVHHLESLRNSTQAPNNSPFNTVWIEEKSHLMVEMLFGKISAHCGLIVIVF